MVCPCHYKYHDVLLFGENWGGGEVLNYSMWESCGYGYHDCLCSDCRALIFSKKGWTANEPVDLRAHSFKSVSSTVIYWVIYIYLTPAQWSPSHMNVSSHTYICFTICHSVSANHTLYELRPEMGLQSIYLSICNCFHLYGVNKLCICTFLGVL